MKHKAWLYVVTLVIVVILFIGINRFVDQFRYYIADQYPTAVYSLCDVKVTAIKSEYKYSANVIQCIVKENKEVPNNSVITIHNDGGTINRSLQVGNVYRIKGLITIGDNESALFNPEIINYTDSDLTEIAIEVLNDR